MIRIVEATDDDVESVLKLIQPFVDQELLLPRDSGEIQRLAKRGFVAREETDEGMSPVIGFSSVDVYSKKMAEIHCLAVHVDYQHMGVGKLLVAECIELAKREGILELMAISSSDNFLKNCGFDYSLPNQKRALFYRFDMQ